MFGPSVTLGSADPLSIKIGSIRLVENELTLSIVEKAPENDGFAGAELGIADNNTTGKFLNQTFEFVDIPLKSGDNPLPALQTLTEAGIKFILVDLPPEQVLAVSDAAQGSGTTIFNVGSSDDSLREENCRSNVLHIAPSRTMLADGLAQYLVLKRWTRWYLVFGSHPEDRLWADALRRAADRFGAKVVGEKMFEDTGGARRTDTGQVQVQNQISTFTQDAQDYDVMIAADENNVFATYLPYRTWEARPVAGSAGLVPSSWHAAHEQWAAMQIQNRFAAKFPRRMRPKDIQFWTAVRIVGEAASRKNSGDPHVLIDYIQSPDFSIAAFKGQKLTFRDWNWQLRQPILLGDGVAAIAVSPQEGFLHETSTLDTLGIDRPETACALK
nr:ABC transporter substrate-binding protein [Rhodoligotrophos appendicifer]